jgi:hypothetical protein
MAKHKTPDGRFTVTVESGASDHWGGLPEPTVWIVRDLHDHGKELFRMSSSRGYDTVYLSDDGGTVIAEDEAGKVKKRIDIRRFISEHGKRRRPSSGG